MTDSTHTAPTDQPVLDVSRAPLPSHRTQQMRRNIPFQFTRFMAFNTRIMRMVLKGHHG